MVEMPQFLYRLRPARAAMVTQGPDERERQTLAAHFAYLERLVADGIVLMAGRTLNADDATFGIVVFVAASPKEAAAVMNGDPAVREGVMRAELFPYRIALWSARGPEAA